MSSSLPMFQGLRLSKKSVRNSLRTIKDGRKENLFSAWLIGSKGIEFEQKGTPKF